MDEKNYLTNRVENQIKWYSKHSESNQKKFKWMRGTVIFLSVMIPFLVGMITDQTPMLKIFAGAAGVLVALLEGLTALNKHQEKWLNYRSTAETLKREKFLFATKTGQYKEADAFPKFVEGIERILARESAEWMEYIDESQQKTS